MVANLEKVWGRNVECEVVAGVDGDFSDVKEVIPEKNERKNFKKKEKTSLSEGIVVNMMNSEEKT